MIKNDEKTKAVSTNVQHNAMNGNVRQNKKNQGNLGWLQPSPFSTL